MIIVLVIFIILIVVLPFLLFGKQGVGMIIDKIGITNDVYKINIAPDIRNDVFIYWLGEFEIAKRDNDKILIFHNDLITRIPPNYGKNIIAIKYKNIYFDKVGIWKTLPYAKYKYNIKIYKVEDNLIINWHINNWYDEGLSGNDTINISR